jgi:hypothetical protein
LQIRPSRVYCKESQVGSGAGRRGEGGLTGVFLEGDPYEILGVSRSAGLDEVKSAYRQAVLKYHPDANPSDPAEARENFRRASEAYVVICRAIGFDPWSGLNAVSGRRYSPADFAFARIDWPFSSPRVVCPACDETVVFACMWALAVVLASVAACGLLASGVLGDPGQASGAAGMAALLGVYLGVYAAMVGGTILLLVLARQVVLVAGRCVLRRALPAPKSQAELTGPPPARELA